MPTTSTTPAGDPAGKRFFLLHEDPEADISWMDSEELADLRAERAVMVGLTLEVPCGECGEAKQLGGLWGIHLLANDPDLPTFNNRPLAASDISQLTGYLGEAAREMLAEADELERQAKAKAKAKAKEARS
jgi:hypothetical protein